MNKAERYGSLVDKIKANEFLEGLKNPFQIKGNNLFCDQLHVGPWSVWQNNLSPEILVIGQDWGDVAYFTKHSGRDDDSNPTNARLQELLRGIGFDPGVYSQPIQQPLFFTNAVLGIKGNQNKKAMSAPIQRGWLEHSTQFTRELVDILEPKAIVTLGSVPLEGVELLFPGEIPSGPLSKQLKQSPIVLKNGIAVFPMFHCGFWGVLNRGRLAKQEDSLLKAKDAMHADWQRVKVFLEGLK